MYLVWAMCACRMLLHHATGINNVMFEASTAQSPWPYVFNSIVTSQTTPRHLDMAGLVVGSGVTYHRSSDACIKGQAWLYPHHNDEQWTRNALHSRKEAGESTRIRCHLQFHHIIPARNMLFRHTLNKAHNLHWARPTGKACNSTPCHVIPTR
jgi:hypothetical protein